MIRTILALIAQWRDECEFHFAVPAQARGGYVGVVVRLRRHEGLPRRPALEHLGRIAKAVQIALSGVEIKGSPMLPGTVVEEIASPYRVLGGVQIHTYCDWSLMAVYQEVADTRCS